MTVEIALPPLPRLQVPRIDADIDLTDIRRLTKWCESIATSHARAAVEADRADRANSPLTECGLCHNMRTLDPMERADDAGQPAASAEPSRGCLGVINTLHEVTDNHQFIYTFRSNAVIKIGTSLYCASSATPVAQEPYGWLYYESREGTNGGTWGPYFTKDRATAFGESGCDKHDQVPVYAAPVAVQQPVPEGWNPAKGDEMPREQLAWMIVQEACETEPDVRSKHD